MNRRGFLSAALAAAAAPAFVRASSLSPIWVPKWHDKILLPWQSAVAWVVFDGKGRIQDRSTNAVSVTLTGQGCYELIFDPPLCNEGALAYAKDFKPVIVKG